ncbi:Endothelial PAS domain-containing protein 1 [Bagarius yarrelli]|uniref:Endothelial PAS domain-containing protein 1 n=1 Tax=Bagarius yarrelli TaxID=175774 RepID=A0A556TR99_BAGYA|nr:Endothelial PAS domain-containing protein 1 [Bagarius yarrelli]
MDSLYLKSLEGFISVVTSDGDMIFLSENINKFIGLTQVELIGHSIFDFTHPCDHDEIRENLSLKTGVGKKGKQLSTERDFFMRMKCTVTSRGRTVNLKSASWKVLHCTGHYKVYNSCSTGNLCGYKESLPTCVVMLCEPIPHPSNIDTPIDNKTFLSRHSMDMKFTYCDERVTELMGYSPEDLLGRSVYDFYHALDSESVTRSHQNLCTKGQTVSGQYRMLAKHGGFVWVETQGTVIYSSRNSQPQCIVCVNYILSDVEEKNTIFSKDQTESLLKTRMSSFFSQAESEVISETDGDLFTKFKEEPEELSHLAPAPGDVEDDIVPLNIGHPSFEEYPVCSKVFAMHPSATHSVTEAHNMPNIGGNFSIPQAPPASSATPSLSSCSTPSSPDDYKCPVDDLKMEITEKLFAMDTQGKNPYSQETDLSDLDLETLAPYIPMDGEDFQLNPICQEEPLPEEVVPGVTQYNFSNIDNLFQPLTPPSEAYFQPSLPSASEKQAPRPSTMEPWPPIFYPNPMPLAHHTNQAIIPLAAMGGHHSLQWPPDPPINYHNAKVGVIDSLVGKNSYQALQKNCMSLHSQSSVEKYRPCKGYKDISPGLHKIPNTMKRSFSQMNTACKADLLSDLFVGVGVDFDTVDRAALGHNIRLKNNEHMGHQHRKTQYHANQTVLGKKDYPKQCCNYTDKNMLPNPKNEGVVSRLLGPSFEMYSLPELTHYDCEVNVPLQGNLHLLQGSDLLCALDQAT